MNRTTRTVLTTLIACGLLGAADAAEQAVTKEQAKVCADLKTGAADAATKSACTSAGCAATVEACFEDIELAAQEETEAKGAAVLNRQLLNVRRWARGLSGPDVAGLKAAEAAAELAVHETLEEKGLVEPFFGALITGPVFQSVAKEPEQGNPGTAMLGTVLFESKHLGGGSGKRLHASVGGKVGYEPIFLMTLPKDAPEGTPVSPSYSSGIVWNVGVNLGVPLGRLMAGETTLYARYGQGHPGPAELVDESEETARIAVPSHPADGLARDVWDVGVKTILFPTKTDQDLAHEKGYLFPAASVHLGMRWDKRFSDDPTLSGFTSPERRLYFGFRINALSVFKDVADSSPYNLTFGVEREWALRSGGLPSGTRIVLAGSVNLLQALGVSKPKAAEEDEKEPDGKKDDDAGK